MSQVTLISSDGQEFKISRKASEVSKLINDMITDIKDSDLESNPVPIQKVTGEVLARVILFLEKNATEPMNEIPKPIVSGDMKVNAGEWYGEFVNALVKKDLFDLINAANFMGIQPLLNLTCCKVASQLYGKKKSEIAPLFGLPADIEFTEEDRKKVYETYPWVQAIKDKLQSRLNAATTEAEHS